MSLARDSGLSEAKRQLLGRYLRGEVMAPAPVTPSIVAVPRATGGPVPLSSWQEQLWLHARAVPDYLPVYNEPVTIHHSGPLDVVALEESLNALIDRHEAWRTTFSADSSAGDPIQVVQPFQPVPLAVVDLRALPRDDRVPEALRLATADAVRAFDLERGPLWRALLVLLADDEQRVFLTLHHLIFDGVALYTVFMRELQAVYQSRRRGEAPTLPPLALQYPEYALWQRQPYAAGSLQSDLGYWRRQLAACPPSIALPTDRPRPVVPSYRGRMHRLAFSAELSHDLKRLAAREGTTLFVTLLAAFAALLARFSSQDDLVIGTVIDQRKLAAAEHLLGYFLNSVPLRLGLESTATFRDLLRQVRGASLDALSHGSVPFSTLVQELQPIREASRSPLFQVMFALEPPLFEGDPAWSLTQMDVDTGTSKYDLYVEVDDRPDGIIGRVVYSTDLFDAKFIARLAEGWQILLGAAVADPSRAVQDLPVLTPSERHYLLREVNDAPTGPQSDACLHDLVTAQAARTPDRVALVAKGSALTYRQLDQRSNALAHHLRAVGVGRGSLVAVCLERSPDMLVGVLAVLKAGGAYVPLDPVYPVDRLAFMLDDSQAGVLLSDSTVKGRLPAYAGQLVCTDDPALELDSAGASVELGPMATAADLAYVIYTSGSTGRPKAVQVEHRNVVNLLRAMQRQPGLSPDDILLAVTTLSFDIAVLELFLPLTVGARVVVASREEATDGGLLMQALHRHRVSVMQATPATWRLLVETPERLPSGLVALCGGEALPPDLARALLEQKTRLWNLYGPTETTIWSTIHPIAHVDGPIPIGRPVANTTVYVLDRQCQPVPVGVPGELYLGGAGVARGYLHQPKLTAERFVEDPFLGDPRARLYRTGDLGRWRTDGALELIGRVDDQVKLRGFRIEPGEVESTLREHAAVREAVLVLREDRPGDQRLVAYVGCADPGQPPDVAELRSYLRSKVPEYMLPSAYVLLADLPSTLNGKLDRQALTAPDVEKAARPSTVVPRTLLEVQVARIWSESLGVPSVGLHDDFFALGGHSLLAVRVATAVERQLHVKLPIAALVRARTVAELARLIAEDGVRDAIQVSGVVAIKPSGTKRPFFCIHGVDGGVVTYAPLARHLDPDRPLYALQPSAPSGLDAPRMRLEDIAAEYADQIQAVQPNGPYLLGGYSSGADLALELAQQLQARGESVWSLVMFDRAASHWPGSNDRWAAAFTARFLENVSYWLEDYMQLQPGAVRVRMQKKLRRFVRRIARGVLPVGSGARRFRYDDFFESSDLPAERLDTIERYVDAWLDYVPRPYPGRVTIFRARAQPLFWPAGPSMGWGGVAKGGVEVRVVSGSHATLLKEPHVRHVAAELNACLDAAEAAGA